MWCDFSIYLAWGPLCFLDLWFDVFYCIGQIPVSYDFRYFILFFLSPGILLYLFLWPLSFTNSHLAVVGVSLIQSLILCFFLFFLLWPWHVKGLGPGIESGPQQWPKVLTDSAGSLIHCATRKLPLILCFLFLSFPFDSFSFFHLSALIFSLFVHVVPCSH